MSRVTVYFLFWIQLSILVVSSVMTGLNAALGDIDNSIVWGLVAIGVFVCAFLTFREMLNKISPREKHKPKAPGDPDPYGPSA